jgi:hypothetical protein
MMGVILERKVSMASTLRQGRPGPANRGFTSRVTNGTRAHALRYHNLPTSVSACCWMFRTEETYAG